MTDFVATSQPITEAHRGYSEVLASALACLLAGLGAGIVAGVNLALLGAGWLTCLTAGSATVAIVAGTLTFWTFARDPISNAWEWEALRLEADRLDDRVIDLEDECISQRNRADRWEAEARRIQAMLNITPNYTPSESELDTVQQDARTLVNLYYTSGESPTVRVMQGQYKWTQGRFAAARKYLEAHGIVEQSATRTKWAYPTREEAEIAL